MARGKHQNIDFRGQLADAIASPLRVRARELAAGYNAGTHRAARKGSGIEFAGHRSYTPGDDLRHLDHHALLRHGQLLVREFYTDTERAVHLLVDVSRSMKYGSQAAQQQASTPLKIDRALLLAAAASYVVRGTGDALGLTCISEEEATTFVPKTGSEMFERIFHQLETLHAQREKANRKEPSDPALRWKKTLSHLGSQLPRGSLILVLSDFFDVSAELGGELARLNSKRRTVRGLQILTPDEKQFPFAGSVRFFDPETAQEIETDADAVRSGYQKALQDHTTRIRQHFLKTGASLFEHVTNLPPGGALRSLLEGDRQ